VSAVDLRSRSRSYIALRRAVGYHDRRSERLLLDFVAFVESHGAADSVTAQVAVDWACGPDLESHRNRAARLSVVRGFLAYVRAAEPRTEIPAVGLLRRPTRRAPHIFSDEEIAAVLRAARALGPAGSLRPHTYATLVGLLVSCGLRISEAAHLRLDDVRLGATPPHLLIAESKFHKSRLVVLHPTVATGLQAYGAYSGFGISATPSQFAACCSGTATASTCTLGCPSCPSTSDTCGRRIPTGISPQRRSCWLRRPAGSRPLPGLEVSREPRPGAAAWSAAAGVFRRAPAHAQGGEPADRRLVSRRVPTPRAVSARDDERRARRIETVRSRCSATARVPRSPGDQTRQ